MQQGMYTPKGMVISVLLQHSQCGKMPNQGLFGFVVVGFFSVKKPKSKPSLPVLKTAPHPLHKKSQTYHSHQNPTKLDFFIIVHCLFKSIVNDYQ